MNARGLHNRDAGACERRSPEWVRRGLRPQQRLGRRGGHDAAFRRRNDAWAMAVRPRASRAHAGHRQHRRERAAAEQAHGQEQARGRSLIGPVL